MGDWGIKARARWLGLTWGVGRGSRSTRHHRAALFYLLFLLIGLYTLQDLLLSVILDFFELRVIGDESINCRI